MNVSRAICLAFSLGMATSGSVSGQNSTGFAASANLRDTKGNLRTLDELRAKSATVVAFWSTDCSLADLYVNALVALYNSTRHRDVAFAIVFPEDSDDLLDISKYVFDRAIPFLALKDVDGDWARSMQIARVPTLCILGPDLKPLYLGRIDDRYGVGFRKAEAKSKDAASALAEIIAGKTVTVPRTEVDGCLIESSPRVPANPAVTYSGQIAAVINARCGGCHVDGGAAPFPLTSYEDVFAHRSMIREVVDQRRMPPWNADRHIGTFLNDRSLSDGDKDAIVSWIDGGAEQGEVEEEPSSSRAPATQNAAQFPIVLPSPIEHRVPAEGASYFTYAIYPQEVTNQYFGNLCWLEAATITPGDPAVVHHMLLFICQEDTELNMTQVPDLAKTVCVIGWAPGDPEFRFPEGAAVEIPKGARLYLEVHYSPNGKESLDRPTVGLKLRATPPEKEIQLVLASHGSLEIPAGDPNCIIEGDFTVTQNCRLVGILPHMHNRGKSFRCAVKFPTGEKKSLLSVPNFDFDWQTMYLPSDRPSLPAGTIVYCSGIFDNSRWNLENPDSNQTVYFGRESEKEMMDCYFLLEHDRSARNGDYQPVVFTALDGPPNVWIELLVGLIFAVVQMRMIIIVGITILILGIAYYLWSRRRRQGLVA